MAWDNKFGNVAVEGMGQDAEIVTNDMGGKQSKAPMAMHLVDPMFLNDWFNRDTLHPDKVIEAITDFMKTDERANLISAIHFTMFKYKGDYPACKHEALIEIAKVLQEGAGKYKPNNWRLIPQEEHINHALNHYMAYLMGDTQDNHLCHCMCRLMMAYATNKSIDFDYTLYKLCTPVLCNKD